MLVPGQNKKGYIEITGMYCIKKKLSYAICFVKLFTCINLYHSIHKLVQTET